MTLDCRFLVSILIVLCFLSAHRFVAFASAQDALEIGRIELADHETRILDAKDLPKGWAVVSDPDLVKFGKSWWMFFNMLQLDRTRDLPIHILSAHLPPGEGLDSDPHHWIVSPYPVISPGPPGSWDDHTTETPKYVAGYDASAKQWVRRIYYVGWRIIDRKKRIKDYRIGFTQWDGTRWKKHEGSILTGTHEWERLKGYSFIGDQSLYYEPDQGPNGAQGTWHMWYQTTSKANQGGPALVHVTSDDGVQWVGKKRLSHAVPFANAVTKTGPFHLDVFVKQGTFYFTGFLYNQEDLSRQGLWITSSRTPDGSKQGDFRVWQPLLYENNGTAWHDSGLTSSTCHATGLFSATLKEEDGRYWLFYHGYYRTGAVNDPCHDFSKNSGAIGRARISVLP